MATAVSRSSGPQRPRKKHSFMSLHKDQPLESTQQPGYFDLYPARAESNDKRSSAQQPGWSGQLSGQLYAFPSVSGPPDDVQLTPQASRTRQPSNPSSESRLPPLRFSGSSAFSHSPPATPTTSFFSDEPKLSAPQQHIEVLMSAPVVETSTMDAFVDGMNGGEDDVFSSMDVLRQGRRRKKSSVISKGFHHPLYHPPLPTPPPGVKLGGAVARAAGDSDADDDDSEDGTKSLTRTSRLRLTTRPGSSRQGSTSTITNNPARTPRRSDSSKQLPSPPASISPPPRTGKSTPPLPSPSPPGDIMTTNASIDEIVRRFVQVTDSPPKPVVPSISEIIRTHAPEHAHKRHKPRLSVTTPTSPPSSVAEDTDQQSQDEEHSEVMSRSSIDSIAEEVQQTLRVSRNHPATALHHTRSFPHTPTAIVHPSSQSSTSTRSPPSEDGHPSPSLSSFSTSANTLPPISPIMFSNLGADGKANPNHALATFLRSPRLTKLLRLKRSPNCRLQVSFSDLGSSTGKPVVVFLGLGCVRYIMGLYDEMAEALGLRLIAIDRWGLGRTDNPPRNSPRGVMEWASVVEEVLDHLNIHRCSIMAHSAGAPYAMAFANRSPERVRGDLCLLAPWVGASEGASGYKWLKYVPTGLIKTAQAAEWKVQAWMLGKPPAVTYTGIGYDVRAPITSPRVASLGRPSFAASLRSRGSREDERPSISSFSDYDDLADFHGHYASRSTIHINGDNSRIDAPPPSVPPAPISPPLPARNRAGTKSTRFFGGLWKSGEASSASPPGTNKSPPKLKALKSMSSLRGGASAKGSPSGPRKQASPRPSTANGEGWNRIISSAQSSSQSPSSRTSSASSSLPEGARGYGRARRSISLSSAAAPSLSRPLSWTKTRHSPSPLSASPISESPTGPSSAALGNALLAASHAESSKGTHADLIQILNHNQKPWGFSYSDFPRSVKVWYGDKDEKIAEGAVRWMEKTMKPGSCDVCIVKGAGHALMYNGSVVVEVLEFLKESWKNSS